jgi:hypothetical protein
MENVSTKEMLQDAFKQVRILTLDEVDAVLAKYLGPTHEARVQVSKLKEAKA